MLNLQAGGRGARARGWRASSCPTPDGRRPCHGDDAPLRRRSALARPGAVPRVLPRRDRPRPGRQPPDRLDRAGDALPREGPRPGPGPVTIGRRSAPPDDGRRPKAAAPIGRRPAPPDDGRRPKAAAPTVARSRWAGRLRVGDRFGHSHAPLPRAVASRDRAARGPAGAGQRARGLGRAGRSAHRALLPALHAGRDLSGWREPHRAVPAANPGRPGATIFSTSSAPPRSSTSSSCRAAARWLHCRGSSSEPRLGLRLCVRPLLSGRDFHALQRENPAFRLRRRRARRPRRLAAVRLGARRGRLGQRRLPARARLVPQLPIRPRARARASTSWRTWARPASSPGTSPSDPRCCSWPSTTWPPSCSPATVRWSSSSGCARRSACGARDAARRPEAARPAVTWSAAGEGRRSSPAIPGSATGAATRSSRCAAYAWLPDGPRKRSRSCSSGAGTSRRECCPTASRTRARPNTTRSTPRSGSSSRSTKLWRPPARPSARFHRRTATGCSRPSTPSSRATPEGTRHGIRADGDGLLAAATPGTQLTWMDACFQGRPVTPRAGKPVEVQALWLNALWLQRDRVPTWGDALREGPGELRRALLERQAWLSLRCRGRDRPARHERDDTPAPEPDLRRRRAAAASSCAGSAPAASSRWSSGRSGRRSGCARSRLRSCATSAATRGTCGSATRPTTRARSGRGWPGRSSRRGSGCTTAKRREAKDRFVAALARPIGTGRSWAPAGDRRRRCPTYAPGLSVPGLVAG